MPLTIDPEAKSCARCGVAGAPICFDCFMGRPFEKDRSCPRCRNHRPIVRQYLWGVACDACAAAHKEAAAAVVEATKKAKS